MWLRLWSKHWLLSSSAESAREPLRRSYTKSKTILILSKTAIFIRRGKTQPAVLSIPSTITSGNPRLSDLSREIPKVKSGLSLNPIAKIPSISILIPNHRPTVILLPSNHLRTMGLGLITGGKIGCLYPNTIIKSHRKSFSNQKTAYPASINLWQASRHSEMTSKLTMICSLIQKSQSLTLTYTNLGATKAVIKLLGYPTEAEAETNIDTMLATKMSQET